jgi:Protein of unknown function (DUF3105)
MTRGITSIGALAAVTLLLGSCGSSKSAAKPVVTSAPATTTTVGGPTTTLLAGLTGVQSFPGLTQNHTKAKVSYPQSPPVGGDHAPVWQNCGVYDQPVANENAVHSLEHGAVWLAYRPDLAADQVAKLRVFAVNQTHVLVTPYTGLTEAVVATAWGRQLRLDSVDDPRIALFVKAYQEGPQTPEPGVTCSGGLGAPIA